MQPSSELEAIIRHWFDCFERGDQSWLERHVSSDQALRLVGTEREDWVRGGNAVENARDDVTRLGGSISLTIDDIEAFVEGTVGWGAATVSMLIRGQLTVWPRWTFVFHQEQGQWKVVQAHSSFGVAPEQLPMLGQIAA
jgi:ketosteroid isomerase-like protein